MLIRPLVLVLAACAGQAVPPPVASAPWHAPPLDAALSIRDAGGQRLSFAGLVDALDDADVVFLGETHLDETTHRTELALLQALADRRPVVLSLEMLERDVQADVDAWLAGTLDDAGLAERIRPWGNHSVAYQPLLDAARGRGLPVLAANFPRPWLRRVGGPEAPFAAFSEEERALLPRTLVPNSDAYWRRADNAMRGHAGRMPAPSDDGRLVSVQSLWDNAMGEAVSDALQRWPGHLVVHVNGGFHTAYGDGTAAQVRHRAPEAELRTVTILPALQPSTIASTGAPTADFMVHAESRAADADQGRHSVTVGRELTYRLHTPDVHGPVPLLIWLPDDGLTAADGLALWRDRLGDDVAIAAFDPPYRAVQADGAEGGSWAWSDSFAADVHVAEQAVERAWGYLLRNSPVDPARVVLAGEGAGATVVARITLATDRMALDGVALNPSGFAPVRDLPLPLPEQWGATVPPERTLTVVADAAAKPFWDGETEAYSAVGLRSEVVAATDDPWAVEAQAEAELRRRLGLGPASAGPRHHVVLDGDAPRARYWARLVGQRVSPVSAVLGPDDTVGDSVGIDLEITQERAAIPGVLPRCPGPFGGTTVLVVDDPDAWSAVQADDPIAAGSRFHRLQVTDDLPEALAELEERGRTNVLVVPAVFYADASHMAALQRAAAPFVDRMTLTWRPGLGDRIGREHRPGGR
ncbi:MAG: putative iron-regulated protein [Myxococcota bacterium]|jgi:uncharacterized iron-regulated protein